MVHNDEGAYVGERTLTNALAYSDNSVFAEVGLDVGTKRIARLAHRMGITTPISTNPAMTIGGLKTGVTPIDMAHAYETIAHGGQRVSGTLGEPGAPVGIEAVGDGSHRQVDHTVLHQVLPPGVATTETEMLETVLAYGTARGAALGQFAAGKTGTTSNYGDAWFVGWDHRYTVAVWVGFPNSLVPMLTEYDGGPVLGGTFPALIWHDFMVSAMAVERERSEEEAAAHPSTHTAHTSGGASTSTAVAEPAPQAPPQKAPRHPRRPPKNPPRRQVRRGLPKWWNSPSRPPRRKLRHPRRAAARERRRAAKAPPAEPLTAADVRRGGCPRGRSARGDPQPW